jgi:hypothetical protein
VRLAARSTWDAAVEPFSRVGLCTVQHLGRKACLTFSAACLRLVIDTLSPAPVIDLAAVELGGEVLSPAEAGRWAVGLGGQHQLNAAPNPSKDSATPPRPLTPW